MFYLLSVPVKIGTGNHDTRDWLLIPVGWYQNQCVMGLSLALTWLSLVN